LPRRKPGTRFSDAGVHSTRVSPKLISTEPSAWRVYWRSMRMLRSSSRRGRSGVDVGHGLSGKPVVG
jgi:hypothetical protein